MDNRIRKPPVNINPGGGGVGGGMEERIPERGGLSYLDQREPSYREGPGRPEGKAKLNMTQMFTTIAAAVLISLGLGVLIFAQSSSIDARLEGYKDNSAQVTENSQRIENVIKAQEDFITEGDFSDFATKGEIPDLSNYVTKGELGEEVDLSNYYTKEEMDALLVVQEGEEEAEVGVTWDPVRWRFRDVEMDFRTLTTAMVTYRGIEDPAPAPDLVDIRNRIHAELEDIDPRTIKEEDIYDIELVVLNSNQDWEVELEDVVFTLVLTPDDYALLDEDMTYLDSDSSPYLDWDSSFEVREREGNDVTRRVEFESSKLSSLTIYENDYSETMDLVLELYYD